MLTRQGWGACAGSLALVGAGRLLGLYELFLAGTALAVLVLATALATSLSRLRLEVAREVHPPRVSAGATSRVDVAVRNVGRRRTPVLRLRDPVVGAGIAGRDAELLLAPLSPGVTRRAAYRLPTERRGIVSIGPLEVVASDPFGLSALTMPAAAPIQLTIYPRVDEIVPMPHTRGEDPHAGAEHPNALGVKGEDFYALRPYVRGDDLRRVHWPSTAHHDDLMVRQDELPWQGRLTVLLDVRQSTNTPASLELLVSAAASVVTTCWRRRDLVRLVATDGHDSGFTAGHAHVEGIMEYLAVVNPSPTGRLQPMLDALRRAGQGGAIVAIVAGVPTNELGALARLGAMFGAARTVVFEPSSWGERGGPPAAASTRGVIRVTASRPFHQAWNEAMQGTRLGVRSGAAR